MATPVTKPRRQTTFYNLKGGMEWGSVFTNREL